MSRRSLGEGGKKRRPERIELPIIRLLLFSLPAGSKPLGTRRLAPLDDHSGVRLKRQGVNARPGREGLVPPKPQRRRTSPWARAPSGKNSLRPERIELPIICLLLFSLPAGSKPLGTRQLAPLEDHSGVRFKKRGVNAKPGQERLVPPKPWRRRKKLRPERIELPTPSLGNLCSIQLSYASSYVTGKPKHHGKQRLSVLNSRPP